MKNLFLHLLACAAVIFCAGLIAGQATPSAADTKSPQSPATLASEITPSAEAEVEARDGRLTLRQRRQLGLTFRNCLQAARKLKAEGTLDADPDIAAAQIAAVISGDPEYAKAYAEVGAVNWDAILAFIERLIPLIMQLIQLFSFDATLAPACDLAAAVPIVCPPACALAA